MSNSENSAPLFADPDELTRRFGVAVREAVLDNKRSGNSIAVWRDGKVVIVPPEEIVWDDTPPRCKKETAETGAEAI